MPKKKKTEETNAAAPAEAMNQTTTPAPALAPAKPVAKKSAAKKVAAKPVAAKKSAAKKALAKTAAPARKKSAEPTDEQISIRAYFIAERRTRHSLGGDPNNDWIQARQELLEELRGPKANGNGSH